MGRRSCRSWRRPVGPVGSRLLGRSALFRYEVRRWRNGTIPDVREAVAGPRCVSTDLGRAEQVLNLVPMVPALTWGRDESRTGEMWNSNSLTSWLLARSNHRMDTIDPPVQGGLPDGVPASSSRAVNGQSPVADSANRREVPSSRSRPWWLTVRHLVSASRQKIRTKAYERELPPSHPGKGSPHGQQRSSPAGRGPGPGADDAATAAGSAPSIHNTQPWRWQLHGDTVDLFLDRRRTLEVTDPDNRLAILSCGAALHHARVSLAADGWHTTVTRLPASAEPGHLASIRADHRIPIEPAAVRRLQGISLRHTDRRPISEIRIDADKLRSIVTAAQQQGTSLQLLRPRQVFDLATAANDADRMETDNAAWQAELHQWAGGTRPLDTGLPDAVIPARVTPTTVTSRDFGHHSDMLIAEARKRTAVVAILHAAEDGPLDWLRAGEALSAAWLTATELMVSVLPLSATIEVPAVREALRHLLNGRGWPMLVLRFAVLDPADGEAPHTPRLSSDRTVARSAP